MEKTVTLIVEELLSGVPWIETFRSRSVTGLSSVVLTFERGTDLVRARQMVQERLASAIFLPNVAQTPTILQPSSSTSRFMMIGVSSDVVDPTKLSMLTRWSIKPKLTGIPGVASVSIWGQRLRQMQVQIDNRRLRDTGLIQDDIVTAAADALWITPITFLRGSTPGATGWIDNPNQRIGVAHKMPIKTPEDMAKVSVAPPHLLLRGKRMALGDVTEVTFQHPLMIGNAFVNNTNGLMLVVQKFPEANTLEVTAAVEQALKELQHGLPGVKIDSTVFQLATYIEDSVGNVTQALIIGAILVVLVIGAFLFNWRTTLIGVVSIPLSLLSAVVVLQWTGTTLNTMILTGLIIALGVVIDDAIIGLERFMERLRERGDQDGDASIAAILLETTLETRGATVYAALIVLLAVSPIFFMGGVSGAFFEPMVQSYALAVLASLVVGLTVTPALSLMLFGGAPRGAGESPVAVALRSGYEAMLQGVVKAPRAVAGVAAVVVVAGLAMWPMLGQSLLPSLKEKALLVNLATAPGTSHQETYRIMSRLGRELKSLPGVRNIGGHVGRAITSDRTDGVNEGQIWVGLDGSTDYDQMTAKVRETVDGYPGLDRSVQSYLRDTVNEALSGETNALVVRIFGRDFGILNRKAEEVRRALEGIDGLADLRAIGQVNKPQVKVRIDLAAAAAANVKPGEVRRSAATMFSGLRVGFLYEAQKAYDVVVWSAPEVRRSLQNIRDVIVEKSNRTHARLGDLATVTMEPTPTVIRHEYNSAYVDVVANVVGRDLGSVHQDVESRLEAIDFPLEYYPKILGEFVERQDVQQRALGIATAALIGIFLLLQACFGSWRLAAIGFLTLPAAMAGGVLAGFATGGVITLGSIVGLLAVLGIAARNGIVLINHYQRLEREEGVAFGVDLVRRGARERMSSILASSTAIVAALLPVAVLGQIPGFEIVQPTAIVIIAGVIASTLITLLVIPALYLAFGAKADRQPDLGLANA